MHNLICGGRRETEVNRYHFQVKSAAGEVTFYGIQSDKLETTDFIAM